MSNILKVHGLNYMLSTQSLNTGRDIYIFDTKLSDTNIYIYIYMKAIDI